MERSGKDSEAGSELQTDTVEEAVPESDTEECSRAMNETGLGSDQGTDTWEGARPRSDTGLRIKEGRARSGTDTV